MSTKTLLVLSISLVFLSGMTFGFSIADMMHADSLQPKTSRELTFATATERAQQVPTSKAADFRVQANLLGQDFAVALASGGRILVRGGTLAMATPIVDPRADALGSLFGQITNRSAQSTMSSILRDTGTKFFTYAQSIQTSNDADRANATTAIADNDRRLAEFLSTLDGSKNPGKYLTTLNAASQALRTSIDASVKNDNIKQLNDQLAGGRFYGQVMDTLTIALASSDAQF